MNEAANFLKIVWNAETKLEDFLNYNPISYLSTQDITDVDATPGAIGSGPFFQRNNSPLKNVDGEDARPGTGDDGSNIPFTEPKYV